MTATKHWLQVFADGADGASAMTADTAPAESVSETTSGAETGVTSSAAGSFADRLTSLGVPQNKIRPQYRQMKVTSATVPTPAPAQEPQSIPADEPTQEAQETKPQRVTWDEFFSDPENNKRMQDTVQKRVRKSKEAEDSMAALAPALEVLYGKYGVKSGDIAALADAINKDDDLIAEQAAEEGFDTPQFREIRELRAFKKARQQADEDRLTQEHFASLWEQGEELKKTFKNFDLMKELDNPAFLRMTLPGGGVSVEQAYYAIHHDEIQRASMQVAAQRTAEQMSANIQARQARPQETATNRQPAPVSKFNPSTMTRQERVKLKANLLASFARGERPKPGDIL